MTRLKMGKTKHHIVYLEKRWLLHHYIHVICIKTPLEKEMFQSMEFVFTSMFVMLRVMGFSLSISAPCEAPWCAGLETHSYRDV